MDTINERVKYLREQLELSQEAFGEKIALVRSGISNIESGKRGVSDRISKLICQEWRVNSDWLLEGKGEIFKTEDDLYKVIIDSLGSLDDMDRKLITEYLKLEPAHKAIFKDFIKNITKK